MVNSTTYSFGMVGWNAVSLSDAHRCLLYIVGVGADFRLFEDFCGATGVS